MWVRNNNYFVCSFIPTPWCLSLQAEGQNGGKYTSILILKKIKSTDLVVHLSMNCKIEKIF